MKKDIETMIFYVKICHFKRKKIIMYIYVDKEKEKY